MWYCVFLGRGFVVRLVQPLELVGFYFTPSELIGFLRSPLEIVGSIFSPLEIDYLPVAVESLMVVLYIWNFLVVFWWQLVQVLQLWMVMLVLSFPGHGLIVMLQLLLHLLRRFWVCQNGEVRRQLCLKFSQVWWFLYNILIICGVVVICQCTIHLIHEEHMSLFLGIFKDQDSSYWWCKWCVIKVEDSKELFMSVQIRIDSGFSHQIHSSCCLIQESIP